MGTVHGTRRKRKKKKRLDVKSGEYTRTGEVARPVQWKPNVREPITFVLVAAALLLAYHWIFSSYFPSVKGGVGHDYGLALPSLLDGFYWYLNNGAFSPPWFTAAFCGGVPAFPDPQSFYFSLPQWLSFWLDPLSAVYLTMLIFALLGISGFYLLLRLCFHTSQATALLGAALFMFNGFFACRLLIGHVTSHAFMLTPLIASLLLLDGRVLWTRLAKVAAAGLLFAYVMYSGGIHILLPMIIALMVIGITHGLVYGGQLRFWGTLAGAGVIGIALSLAKLTAALAFLRNFERTDYLLPGAASIWGLLRLSFESLFLQPSRETVRSVLVNVQWRLDRHEFEYGITVVPLFMLLAAIPFRLCKGIKKPRVNTAQWLQVTALLVLLLIPLAVNYYTPGWNALLKEIPVIRSSSILFRWLCVYIPVFILFAALAFDKVAALKAFRPYLAAAGILAVVVINASVGRDYYATQPYNPTPIVKAYRRAQTRGQPPTIDKIIDSRGQNGKLAMNMFRNTSLVQGASQLFCYGPIFGYWLEHFPLRKLHPGPVFGTIDGDLNLKNPACYVFDEANGCQPGDHFSVSQTDAVRALTNYHPYDFELPWWQRVANVISLATLAAVVLFLLISGLKPLSIKAYRGSIGRK